MMYQQICPKLPMRNKALTKDFYLNKLSFCEISDYGDYLILEKDEIEIHFFEFKDLIAEENYGMVYIRVSEIEILYENLINRNVEIHPNGKLEVKPWKQKEFSILDPDYNLITFGENL